MDAEPTMSAEEAAKRILANQWRQNRHPGDDAIEVARAFLELKAEQLTKKQLADHWFDSWQKERNRAEILEAEQDAFRGMWDKQRERAMKVEASLAELKAENEQWRRRETARIIHLEASLAASEERVRKLESAGQTTLAYFGASDTRLSHLRRALSSEEIDNG